MALGWRSRVTRGGNLVAQAAFLVMAIAAFAMREELGPVTWVFAVGALGGMLVLALWQAPESEAERVDLAMRVAEEAIKREAKRLDSRRADIEKVLMAYGEWMEFPNFDELHNVQWATPERSERDARVSEMLDQEADRVLQKMSAGEYWENGQMRTRTIFVELWEFVEKIAKIHNPGSEKPILETNMEELLKSFNRVSLQVILLLEEVPIVDVKDWNLRQVSEGVRKASKVVKKYEDLESVLKPVRYLWHGSKFLLASNPLLAAGWIAGSKLMWMGGKKFGKRTIDAYLLSLLRQTLGIVAWETASIYDRTHRYRNPEFVYGLELAHLVSEFPLTPESLRAALKELGALVLRSSYDRIFLYRCVAQHVSPRPERFSQAELLTEETRRMMAERLHRFFRDHVEGAKEKTVASWRKGVGKRLGVSITPVAEPGEGPGSSA